MSDAGRFVTDACLVPMCARVHKAGDGPCDIAQFCPECSGFGFLPGRGACTACGGNGVARREPQGEESWT